MNNCIFCKIIEGTIPSKTIYEDEIVKIIMDVHPVVDGHLLILPKQHIEDFTKLPKDTLIHINEIAKNIGNSLVQKLNAKGLTMTVNYLDAQEIKHYHLHLLPDYQLRKKTKRTLDEIYNIIKNEK